MLVSIIVPAHNAESTLAQCLEACTRQTYEPVEIIVVDDGSTDATSRIVQSFPVHYIRQDQRGPAAARNRGAAEAQGEVLAFTDSDCIPRADWIASLVAEFADGVAGVGGTYDIANPEHLLARIVHEEIVDRHARLDRTVDFLGSFNVAYRREAFMLAGGFDEGFPRASAEDNDLAYRLHDDGGTLRFSPDAVVAHHHPTRLWAYLMTQMRHGFWRMRLYARHPRRARGDQYAGLLDLATPPLALIAMTLVPCAAAALALHPLAGAVLAGAAATLLCALPLAHLPRALAMVRRTGDRGMLAFAPLASLRDGARGLGMALGVMRFMLVRGAAA